MKEIQSTEFHDVWCARGLASGAVFLERQINAIERAATENPGLVFDLANSTKPFSAFNSSQKGSMRLSKLVRA